MTLQAIETRYNGHRFRSRTEARWAVLFDHLGVAYEYEREGYELPDGTRYLPDFYMPREDCFFEIKGAEPSEAEIHKAGLLAYETGKFVNLLVGQPGQHQVWPIRPCWAPTPNAVAWLALAPTVELWLRLARSLRGWGVAILPEHAPNEYIDGARVGLSHSDDPRYSLSGNPVVGVKKTHFELDYDRDAGRLAIWTAYVGYDYRNEYINERYGLYDIEYVPSQTNVTYRPIGADDASLHEESSWIELSDEWLRAVATAKAARFEFGESG